MCLAPGYPLPTVLRLLDAVGMHAAEGGVDPAAYCGLLLNLLAGSSASGLRQGEWARHVKVAGAAVRAALAAGGAHAALAMLAPPLLAAVAAEQQEQDEGGGGVPLPLAAHGLMELCIGAAPQLVPDAEAASTGLPPDLCAALPSVMLQYVSACGRAADAGSNTPSAAAAAQRCIHLVQLAPGLLPLLLAGVGSAQDAFEADTCGSMLGAALQLLTAAASGAPALRPALLEQQEGLRAALAACRGADAHLGAATHAAAACRAALAQLEGLCTVVCGWE